MHKHDRLDSVGLWSGSVGLGRARSGTVGHGRAWSGKVGVPRWGGPQDPLFVKIVGGWALI